MAGLKYYMHDGPKALRFELSGSLAGLEVRRLDQAWRTASSTIGERILTVDVSLLTSADEEGHDLLARWRQAGALFVANSSASRMLLAGYPHTTSSPTSGRSRFIAAALRAAGIALIFVPAVLYPETVSASGHSAALLEPHSAPLSSLNNVSVSAEIDKSWRTALKRSTENVTQ
ncbi:MAG TPA: hypothetical protein VMT15_19440 [Bryobacteraceae bacterium]|nr:hypothetical protein [Bryobacteraceae bacterium]